jgi:hypothetical protein
LRKIIIVFSALLCVFLSAAPSFASYLYDGAGTGVETRLFYVTPSPTVTETHNPIVNNIQLNTAPPESYNPPKPSHGSLQSIAAQLVSSSQLGCFDAVINRESGWDVYATNPSSGAYGLPQALPGSKMASEGSDWRWNPWTQLRWAVKYMNRWGGPCGSWRHELQFGWY